MIIAAQILTVFYESDFDEHQSLLDAYNTDTELEISDGSETETTDDAHIIARGNLVQVKKYFEKS